MRPGDTTQARRVAAHLRDYRAGLHEHHTTEDQLLWPLLLARVELETDLVLRMETQHDRVAEGLATLDRLVGPWEQTAAPDRGESLAVALTAHAEALHEHLHDEEVHILPLVERHLTVEEWNRLGARSRAEMPKDKLLLFLGAMLEDATPTEQAELLGSLPAPAKLAWRLVGRRRYAKSTRSLRAGIPA